jgi:hypothetical protein
MSLLLALFLCGALALSSSNLTGSWVLEAAYEEGYTVSGGSDGSHYTAACTTGPCTSWKAASISVNGTALHVRFDSGFEDDGVLADAPAQSAEPGQCCDEGCAPTGPKPVSFVAKRAPRVAD